MSHPASLTTIQGFLETWLFWLYAPERLELQNPSQPTWNCLFMIMTKASAAVDTIIITCLKKLIQLSGTWISIWIALNPLFGSLVEPFTLEELDSTWSPKTYSYSAFILHAKPFYRGGGVINDKRHCDDTLVINSFILLLFFINDFLRRVTYSQFNPPT